MASYYRVRAGEPPALILANCGSDERRNATVVAPDDALSVDEFQIDPAIPQDQAENEIAAALERSARDNPDRDLLIRWDRVSGAVTVFAVSGG